MIGIKRTAVKAEKKHLANLHRASHGWYSPQKRNLTNYIAKKPKKTSKKYPSPATGSNIFIIFSNRNTCILSPNNQDPGDDSKDISALLYPFQGHLSTTDRQTILYYSCLISTEKMYSLPDQTFPTAVLQLMCKKYTHQLQRTV